MSKLRTSNYSEVLSKLTQKVYQKGVHYSLDHIVNFLAKLGSPEKKIGDCIHVAGTNGKGSTITFMASALMASGYNVGTYTSPHLESYTERFCVNNKTISENLFCQLFDTVCETEGSDILTEFELLTVMSFLYFEQEKPNIILYETGLGGRLDATNVIYPIATIITKIDKDHESILGDTLEAITKEKAGIIKPATPIFTSASQTKAVLSQLQEKASKVKAPFYSVPPTPFLPSHYTLNGSFQQQNVALAKEALHHLFPHLPENTIQKGLEQASLWGRFLEIQYSDQTIIIDAAHNPAAIHALFDSVNHRYPNQPITCLFGIRDTKSATAMINAITPHTKKRYYCDQFSPEAWPYSQVIEHHPEIISMPTPNKKTIPKDPVIVITGSIYFIGWLKSLCVV